MKKLSLLLLIALTISCSKDENNERTQSNSEPILGSWQFGDVVDTFNDGTVDVISATECDLMSSYTFEADNDIVLVSYVEDINDNCELESGNIESFKWSNNGNGNYVFSSREIDGTESVKSQKITFDNNVMVITEVTSNKTRKEYYNRI